MDESPTQVMESPQPEPNHAGTDEPHRSRLVVFVVVVVILLACVVAGLGFTLLMGRDSHDMADQVTPMTIPTTTSEQSRDLTRPPEGDPGGESDTEAPADVPPETTEAEEPAISDEPAAPCNASALAATVGGSIDGHPVNVTDFSCTSSGDHAWALLTPTEAGLDPLYVYFRDVGGGWETLDYGTSISCTEVGIPAGECAQLP